MAHSSTSDEITLLVDGEVRPVTDQALGAWLRRRWGLSVVKRALENPLVVFTCTQGATRQALADGVGRLVWFSEGMTTVEAEPLDHRDWPAGGKVIFGVHASGAGWGGRFRSVYPQGAAGDRVRWAYRKRFAGQAAGWLLEHRADAGSMAPAYAPPLPFGRRGFRGLSYFDRREHLSRAAVLGSSVIGSSYVAWEPNHAYRPGAFTGSGQAAAAGEPWTVRELGGLPFDPQTAVFVLTYFAEGQFAVYDQRSDTSYWETPQAFGSRLRKDLTAAEAIWGHTPLHVVLLSDFEAVPGTVRAQVARALDGPQLITVNTPATLFTDDSPGTVNPRTRIALLPTTGAGVPQWASTSREGISTRLPGETAEDRTSWKADQKREDSGAGLPQTPAQKPTQSAAQTPVHSRVPAHMPRGSDENMWTVAEQARGRLRQMSSAARAGLEEPGREGHLAQLRARAQEALHDGVVAHNDQLWRARQSLPRRLRQELQQDLVDIIAWWLLRQSPAPVQVQEEIAGFVRTVVAAAYAAQSRPVRLRAGTSHGNDSPAESSNSAGSAREKAGALLPERAPTIPEVVSTRLSGEVADDTRMSPEKLRDLRTEASPGTAPSLINPGAIASRPPVQPEAGALAQRGSDNVDADSPDLGGGVYWGLEAETRGGDLVFPRGLAHDHKLVLVEHQDAQLVVDYWSFGGSKFTRPIIEIVTRRVPVQPGDGQRGQEQVLATVLGIIERLATTTVPTPLSELFPDEDGFRHPVEGVKYRPRSDQGIGFTDPRQVAVHYSLDLPVSGLHSLLSSVRSRMNVLRRAVGSTGKASRLNGQGLAFAAEVTSAAMNGWGAPVISAEQLDRAATRDPAIEALRGFLALSYAQTSAIAMAKADNVALPKNLTLAASRTSLAAWRSQLSPWAADFLEQNHERLIQLWEQRMLEQNTSVQQYLSSLPATAGLTTERLSFQGRPAFTIRNYWLTALISTPPVSVSQAQALDIGTDFALSNHDSGVPVGVVELRYVGGISASGEVLAGHVEWLVDFIRTAWEQGVAAQEHERVRVAALSSVGEGNEMDTWTPNPPLLTQYKLTVSAPTTTPFVSYPPASLSQGKDFPFFTAVQESHLDVKPPIKVSADFTVAINGSLPFVSSDAAVTMAQEFYATEEVFETAQAALQGVGSGVTLVKDVSTSIRVPGPDGPLTLVRIAAAFGESPRDESQVIAGQVMGDYPGSVIFSDHAGTLWSAPVQSDGSDISGLHHLASWLTTGLGLGSNPDVIGPQGAAEAISQDTGIGVAPDAPLVGQVYGSALNPAGNRRLRAELEKRAKRIGVNEFARPKIGQAYVNQAIFGADEKGKPDPKRNYSRDNDEFTGFRRHFAAVVAESQDGLTQITLENYARRAFNDRVAEHALRRNLQAHGDHLDEIETALIRSTDVPGVKEAKLKLIAELRALKELTDLSGEPLNATDPRYVEARNRARGTVKRLSDLASPGLTWHFKMYSRRPGETFHEQQTVFYDSSVPAKRNNPLTAVVDASYDLSVRPVKFKKKQHELDPETRKTLAYTLVRPLLRLSRRRSALGLNAPVVKITGFGNGDLLNLRPDARRIRADDVRRQLEQMLVEQAQETGMEVPPVTITTAIGQRDWFRSHLDQDYRKAQRTVTIDVIMPAGTSARSTPAPSRAGGVDTRRGQTRPPTAGH